MPHRKASAPSYRYHVSGKAVVTFSGKNLYLGEHNSPESWAKYYARLAEYHANGRSRIVALESLEPLRYGQTTAAESKVVESVDIEAVRLTARHLLPTLKAMVTVQVATA